MQDMAVDGRTARRNRNRQAVVEAALGLIDEGSLDPSVEEITKRSGVSQRSIFRYFDGLDDLRQEVVAYNFERVQGLIESENSEGTFDDRVKHFLDVRLKLYAVAGNLARAARTKAPYAPSLAEHLQHQRDVLDEQIKSTFAKELKKHKPADAREIMLLISSLVSFDCYEQLGAHHGRSRTQIRKLWTRGLSALLR